VNANNKDRAREFAVRAAAFEEYKDRMTEILARIDKMK
jgi:hypothetical protein